ncbi:DUF1636 domain-containing protein [Shimia sp. R10_1]|uniref:DUF1636 family protein n=1 Tax=Shimia sp. R10_1 TaxID=2821095 RepID=UPI001ADA3D43|nr:DUF1636 domain-containing protein [Shimia sp. R10_1]MBO9474236.1 DUF1636 domain-containing protein [Shimia sp. R10_1]
MNGTVSHRMTICTSCRHTGETCNSGYALIAKLRAAISAAGDNIADDFEIAGTACLDGCDRPCTVGYHATRTASFLFGDITPEEDIDSLMDFAKDYAAQQSDWWVSTDHPIKLRDTTLTRIPCAIMAIEDTLERVS